jgi:hypothetical protein
MLINLTMHDININGDIIPPSGGVARCSEGSLKCTSIDGYPVAIKQFTDTIGLPPAKPDTYYIVSTLVRISNPHRTDILSPDLPVRDDCGNIIGCQIFIKNKGS